jgi:hypothetical protein
LIIWGLSEALARQVYLIWQNRALASSLGPDNPITHGSFFVLAPSLVAPSISDANGIGADPIQSHHSKDSAVDIYVLSQAF